MDAVDVEAVQVQMLSDFFLLHNRGHFLVASLVLVLFCIVHKVFAKKFCGDRLFYGGIVPVLIVLSMLLSVSAIYACHDA